MNDFIDHLLSRSFGLDNHSQNVRPRLPSLFETPLAEQQKLTVPFAATPEPTNAERDPAPEGEHEPAAPVKRFSPDFAATVRPNTNLSRAGRNSPDGKRYSGPDLPGSHDQPQQDEKIRSTVNDSGRSTGHGPSAESLQPLFKVDSFATRERIIPPGNLLPANRENFSFFPERRMQSAEANSEIDPLITGKPDAGEKVANRVVDQLTPKHALIPPVEQQNLPGKDEISHLTPKRVPSLRVPADAAELKLSHLSPEIFDHKPETVAEPAERVINVTIGRIEIRATPGSSAPVRKSHTHKPSTMSLDDYLNKRNGGVR